MPQDVQRAEVRADERRYYKYVSRATARIVLENRTLRWSSPLMFNDPFDNQFDLHLDFNEEVRQLALDKMWEGYCGNAPMLPGHLVGQFMNFIRTHARPLSRQEFEHAFRAGIDEGAAANEHSIPVFHQQIRQLARQHKILCLAQTATSLLMWAYYAEGHQGAVLVFHTPANVDSPWPVGHEVQYSENMPRLMDNEGLSDVFAGRAHIAAESALQRLVYTKSIDWAHEREWRIFSGAGRNPGADFDDAEFNAQELYGVIMGCKMPADDQQAISALVVSTG